jgi:adenylate cyclase
MKPPLIFSKSFLPAGFIRILIVFSAVMLTAWSQWGAAPDQSYLANEWLRDHFIRARASVVPEPRMAVVDIDESSLAAVGPWPWPRERLANLVENLVIVYGAKGVAFDIVLPEHADAAGDAQLAMLAQSAPLVLAQAFDYAKRSAPLRVGTVAGGSSSDAQRSAIHASGFIGNHAGLAQARTLGNIGMQPDNDGMIRRLPMLTWFEGQSYPTLALALFQCCSNSSTAAPGPFANAAGLWRIPYSRAWSAYTVAPASDILNLRVPGDAIKGRLVLVGSSSLGLSDRVATPLDTSTPGVLVHAAALSTLMDAQAGQTPTPWPGRLVALFYSLMVALIAAYIFPRLSALVNVLFLAGASLLWLVLAFWLSKHDPMLSVTGTLASNLFLLAVAVPFDWQLAQRKSRHLLGTLHQYVAKSVVDELLRSDVKNPLAPRQCNVTTLIADMQGYTGQVESLSIEEAAQLTRDFLQCLTQPILEKQGTLDKYTGDGLVAFWGAPLPIEDHADLALDAAQEIVRKVRQFSVAREREGKSALRVRIGIESGSAMAGDFGTSSRSVYTAVGDSVNVASRLEDAARNLPHDIVIGQGTVNLAKRHGFLKLGEVVLRGKEKPTTLYALQETAA